MVHNATDGIKVSGSQADLLLSRSAGNRWDRSEGLRVLQMAAYRLHLKAQVFTESRLGAVCAYLSLLSWEGIVCTSVVLSSDCGPLDKSLLCTADSLPVN